jgi:spermidine synthase
MRVDFAAAAGHRDREPMKPSELLAETVTPDGMRMTLSEHAGDYTIEVDGRALMSTRAPGSERAMAELAARELEGRERPRLLIGGLGLGFTLEAALESFPSTAAIVVVEYFRTIVDWNRKFGFGSGEALSDPRVRVEVADVVDHLNAADRRYDAILLDVDNGPDAWTMASNDRLYDRRGLERIRRALAPGGLLAVWSAQPSAIFEKRMVVAGFAARSETVRSRGRKGERHTIFIGRLGCSAS